MFKDQAKKLTWMPKHVALILFIGLFGRVHGSSFPPDLDSLIIGQDTIPHLAVDFNEIPPEPEMGYEAYYKYISRKYKTPKAVRRSGRRGSVLVRFVIEPDGSLTEMEAVKTFGEGTGEEGIRVIKEGPKWKPGMQLGKPVRVSMTFPIPINNRPSLQMEDRERELYERGIE